MFMSNRPLTTEQDLIIIEGSVLGDKGRDIAAKAGCSPATVSIYQRGRLKELIEQVRTRWPHRCFQTPSGNVARFRGAPFLPASGR